MNIETRNPAMNLSHRQQMHTGNTGDSYFFQYDYGKQYSRDAVATNFRKLLWRCGISYGGRKRGPHLQQRNAHVKCRAGRRIQTF